ncbi:MAG: peptidoglycan-binding protein, partial [Rhodospirillaceae bacterium]|nr:peptidoglycan-binding protein [Rhodospirillaceae bacterium]
AMARPAPSQAAAAAPAGAQASPPAGATGEGNFVLSLSREDRRRIQSELQRLGYYDGSIDGDFGPGTRAAVRRYQEDIGEEATGQLTPAQAMRLLADSQAASQ